MKSVLIIPLIVLLFLAGSCSNPSPEAKKYTSEDKTAATNQTGNSNEPVDVTSQPNSALSAEAAKTEKPAPGEELKQVVSPQNFPKAIDQFAAVKKVWEKMKEMKNKGETSPFLFNINDMALINGKPLVDMKALLSPVPLFDTWNTSKIQDIEQVKTLISNGTQVRIISRHIALEGNWYLVTPIDTGIENVKGWLPEKLLADIKPIPQGELGVPSKPGDSSGAGSSKSSAG